VSVVGNQLCLQEETATGSDPDFLQAHNKLKKHQGILRIDPEDTKRWVFFVV